MAEKEPTPLEREVSRRGFLQLGYLAFAGFWAGVAGAVAKFMFPNVLYEPSQVFKAGKPEEYPPHTVSERFKKDQRVWIVNDGKGIYCIWARCTHLGCTPNWFSGLIRFRCPCHGSNFNLKGDVIAGPAPQPLWRCALAKTSDGELVVDKGRLENRPGLRDREPFYLPIA